MLVLGSGLAGAGIDVGADGVDGVMVQVLLVPGSSLEEAPGEWSGSVGNGL